MERTYDWETFEQIMTGILSHLDVGKDIEYFAVVDDDGDIKFWAGTRSLDKEVSMIASNMYRLRIERAILAFHGLHMILFWLGGYVIAVTSKDASSVGLLATLIENKYAEEIERLKSAKDLLGINEKKSSSKAHEHDLESPQQLSARIRG